MSAAGRRCATAPGRSPDRIHTPLSTRGSPAPAAPPAITICGVANPFRKSPSASTLPSGPTSWKSTDRFVRHTVFPVFLSSATRYCTSTAVEVHDQQLAEHNRRRAGAAEVVALEVAPLPHDLAGCVSIAAVPARSEGDVNATRLDDRRRRRVRIERVCGLRRRDGEERQVEEDPAGRLVDRERRQRAAVFGRRRDPDLRAENHRRRPAPGREWRLPPHVLRLRPTSAAARSPATCRCHRVRGTAATAPGSEAPPPASTSPRSTASTDAAPISASASTPTAS